MFTRIICALSPTIKAGAEGQLLKLARRVADNRVVAGVHFPIDSPAGFVLADVIADYFLAKCVAKKPVTPVVLDGTALDPYGDADSATVYDDQGAWSKFVSEGKRDGAPAKKAAAFEGDLSSPLLVQMWSRATTELTANGF